MKRKIAAVLKADIAGRMLPVETKGTGFPTRSTTTKKTRALEAPSCSVRNTAVIAGHFKLRTKYRLPRELP